MRKFLFAIEVTGDQNLKKEPFGEIISQSETIHHEVKRGKEINEECKYKEPFNGLSSQQACVLTLAVVSRRNYLGKFLFARETYRGPKSEKGTVWRNFF